MHMTSGSYVQVHKDLCTQILSMNSEYRTVPLWSVHIKISWQINFVIDKSFFIFLYYYYFLLYNIVLVFAIYQHASATGVHVFPILNPPPTSFPIPSLWVIPVHQPQVSCILHWTWTGNSFLIWYYTCFNDILPNHPPHHRVQKTVLYICVSFAVLHTGLSLPSF